MNYEMEELIPVVAMLAEKYTSKESTSITYEKARQLMEAVIYTISQWEDDTRILCSPTGKVNVLTALDSYQYGYKSVLEKVKYTQEIYNEMIMSFCSYGNENYKATVERALPGFFKYYDARLAPQETIITMDYPTIRPIGNVRGIDAIAKYVEYISYEQKFLGAFPQEYVYETLYRFQRDYRSQFYNICSVILRHVLCHMLVGRRLGEDGTKTDYEILRNMVSDSIMENKQNEKCKEKNRVEKREENKADKYLKKKLSALLTVLVEKKYAGDKQLEEYLKADLDNFVIDMQNAAEYNVMEKVFVL